MNIQDIRQSFAPVLEHLNTVGTAVLAVEATKHKAAPGAHCLLDYKRQSSTIAGWPIVGDCDFQVEYDTKLGNWTVSGKAFGMDFVGNTGAFDREFEKTDKQADYAISQDDYDWWSKVVADNQALEYRIAF